MFMREQGTTTALNRILCEVLLYKDDSPVVLALDVAGITNLTDFMSLRCEDIPTLVFQPLTGGKPKPLRLNDVGMIQTLVNYGRQLIQDNGGVLSIEQWDAITREEFDEFRIRGPSPQPTIQTATQSRPAPKQADLVADFNRGSSAMLLCIPSSRTRTNGPTGTVPLSHKRELMMFMKSSTSPID